MELGQFGEFFLDETDQFDIGIEMDGMHVHVHGKCVSLVRSLMMARLFPSPWMGLGVDFPEFFDGVVGIHLCSGQIGVPKEFLHRIEVCAMLEHVCSERMAQDVWTSFLLGSDPTKVVCHEALYGTAGQRFAVDIHKKRFR